MTWVHDTRRAHLDRELSQVSGIDEWTEDCRGDVLTLRVNLRHLKAVLRERAKVSRTREVVAPLRLVEATKERGVA